MRDIEFAESMDVEPDEASIAERGIRAIGSVALVHLTGIVLYLGSAGLVLAEGLPLVLTNDNIGMSSAEIDETQGPDDFKDLDVDSPEILPDESADGILTFTEADLDPAPWDEESTVEASEFRSVESTEPAEVESVEEIAKEPAPVEEEIVVLAATDDDCSAAAGTAGIASFEQCVEAAIRGGNGYTESSGVCRSIFPAESTPTS